MSVADKYRAKYGMEETDKAKTSGSVEAKYRAKYGMEEADKAETFDSVEAKYRAKYGMGEADTDGSEPSGTGRMGRARRLAKARGPDTSSKWDRMRALQQGVSFGFADELESAVKAGATHLLQPEFAGDSFGETYDQNMAELKDRRDEYARLHGGENLVLNLTGGISTAPVTGVKLLKALQATKAMQGTGAALKAKQAAALTGVGGLEGAVAGAGAADQGERMEGATKGALIGAAAVPAVAGVGKVLRGTAKGLANVGDRLKVTTPLGKGENFIPLPVAAPDSMRGLLYGNVFGNTLTGGRMLRDQAAAPLARMEQYADEMTDYVQHGLPKAQREQRRVLEHALDQDVREGRRALLGRTRRTKEVTDARVKATQARIKGRTQSQLNAINEDFRVNKALPAATPSSMPAEELARIQSLTPTEANEALSSYWLQNGFQSVKKNTFEVVSDAIEQKLKRLFAEDPELSRAAGDFVPGTMATLRSKMKGGAGFKPDAGMGMMLPRTGKAPATTISGKDLMDLRNTYATMANNADGLARTANRKIADALDSEIMQRLSPEDLAQYQDDLSRWGAYKAYDSAVVKAVKGGNEGMFTPREFQNAGKGYQLGKGRAALQDETMALDRAQQQIAAEGAEAAKTPQLKKWAEKQRQNAADKAQIAREGLTDTKREQLARDAENAAEQSVKAKEVLQANTEKVKQVKNLLRVPGIYQQLAAAHATSLPGKMFQGFTGMVAGPVAPLMATPTVQRFMAGQQPWQEGLVKALRAELPDDVWRAIVAGSGSGTSVNAVQSE